MPLSSGGEQIMVCVGISKKSCTELVIYKKTDFNCKILRVRQFIGHAMVYVGLTGIELMLMHDNVRPHVPIFLPYYFNVLS